MDIIKIIGIAFIAVIIIVILNQYRPEFAIYASIIAGVLILTLASGTLSGIIDMINSISSKTNINSEFLVILIKITGIAILTEFAVSICKDSGESAIASKVDIGGKIYNGYSIVSNNTNEEVVTEESIYIAEKNDTLGNPGYYYRVGDTTLNTQNLSQNNYIGVFNMDFERKSMPITDGQTDVTQWIYYYPKPQLGSYTSIVSATSMDKRLRGNIYEYLEQPELQQLAKLYYTALGRERYGMYKLERNAEQLKQTYK